MITTATGRVGARVLIGAGWSRFGQHQPQEDRVRVATGVLNYDRVLPRCRVAVHHGGSGTVAASVTAGIPSFVCSLVADNPFWGARVEPLGIGVHERFADLDQDRLEAGLRRALHAEVITRSRAIGDTLRADTGAAGHAADLIESTLPTDRLSRPCGVIWVEWPERAVGIVSFGHRRPAVNHPAWWAGTSRPVDESAIPEGLYRWQCRWPGVDNDHEN